MISSRAPKATKINTDRTTMLAATVISHAAFTPAIKMLHDTQTKPMALYLNTILLNISG
jgi:hypothetical protein